MHDHDVIPLAICTDKRSYLEGNEKGGSHV